jgi:hypothetical protein
MTTIQSIESSPDTIIQDLHRVREMIVDSYGGDLHKLTADARERQIRSGKAIWQATQPCLTTRSSAPAPQSG